MKGFQNQACKIAVACGYNHGLALKADGTLWAWGYNYSGQLGDGTKTTRLSPVKVQGLTGTISMIACGALNSLCVTQTGDILNWGYNYAGQLGDGTKVDRTVPVQLQKLDLISP